ncbi:hypothetical protein AB0C60_26480, partial [Streptomyces sp. NPDC048845]
MTEAERDGTGQGAPAGRTFRQSRAPEAASDRGGPGAGRRGGAGRSTVRRLTSGPPAPVSQELLDTIDRHGKSRTAQVRDVIV